MSPLKNVTVLVFSSAEVTGPHPLERSGSISGDEDILVSVNTLTVFSDQLLQLVSNFKPVPGNFPTASCFPCTTSSPTVAQSIVAQWRKVSHFLQTLVPCVEEAEVVPESTADALLPKSLLLQNANNNATVVQRGRTGSATCPRPMGVAAICGFREHWREL
ncbi:hypothetical protein EYF80_036332 [Liparis tanakae]|uniref:Uncharacterized protein n=1 Tax=Liparis tanakae TaxID=230148 RepID=A0A4Z2GJS6_9TELE|nr:hypothetical protein EYF80_036332 [Liparis tanakae]